ncbi:NPCBM/NEW2 domain-containing protein [Arenibacter nanhaiticus]|uniref:NPCBM/NEW2 domain-containing protein n=1 Tax=Arenibacter nanhaiticus TaxID=558155 RepID=A0A1M6CDQ2_9FLAO|nr:NPCBM/NEW2 domain-containing protein [Arenibacter nanhaiticus]SHI59116.1 NPCBM/NEW2 domain-containing protein [Arenibacter nanhaiticus]
MQFTSYLPLPTRVYKSNLLLLLIFLVCSLNYTVAQQSPSGVVSLSELEIEKAVQPWWPLQKNTAITGAPLTIAGTNFKKGIGTLSESSVYIFLDGKGDTFKAEVGLQDPSAFPVAVKYNALSDGSKLFYTQDETGKKFVGIANSEETMGSGSVQFVIKGDGKLLWRSKKIKGGQTPTPIALSLKGIKVLELTVNDGDDGISGDHAVWGNPEITYSSFKPILVDANYINTLKTVDNNFNNHLKPLIEQLPVGSAALRTGVNKDWLVEKVSLSSNIYKEDNGKEIMMSNGLVSRTFRLSPNCATVDFKNLTTGESLLRGVSPEAMLTIDGQEYAVGGLDGQKEYGYLKKEWLDDLWSPDGSFQLSTFTIGDIQKRIEWPNKRWSLESKQPQKGKSISFTYHHSRLKDIEVQVHYNIYDGIPLISKWFTITNKGSHTIVLNNFKSEILAMVEAESAVEKQRGWETPNIHVESDYAFHSMSMKNANKVVHWEKDPRYTSQASYLLATPCLLECKLPIGPNEAIAPAATFESFRIWELPYDSSDKQRKGLYTNAMYAKIAPWVTENPLFLHVTTTEDAKVKAAIDQCAETGYEMVILSFGSGLNMEDLSESNIAKFKALADYAHAKGIELGGYSLLSSRWISDEVDVINPETGKRGGVIHGSSPCLNSQWGIDYFEKLKVFFEKTGFDLLEHDGSYPGQLCASTAHVGHRGLEDSQWKSWKRISDFYKWCNEKGIFLNIPDWYYLSGSTKNSIGYREVNWSLPRERQLVLGRQNMFDGTYDRLPSMSWTFVPLTEYHGGGAAATIEPLDTHVKAYKAHMIQNYGMGLQACYRGPRLYDTERTKSMVIEVVDWYKKYRDILNSPIVHLKRANGREMDGIMHVNPELKEKGMAMFFNPTNEEITQTIQLPLYYTGLTEVARIQEKEGPVKTYTLERDYSVPITVKIPAHGYNWFKIH